MEEEIREFEYDEKIGYFGLFDELDFDELKSLLKSNRFTKGERHIINHMYMPSRFIREVIPAIAMVTVCSVILDICKDLKFKKKIKELKRGSCFEDATDIQNSRS